MTDNEREKISVDRLYLEALRENVENLTESNRILAHVVFAHRTDLLNRMKTATDPDRRDGFENQVIKIDRALKEANAPGKERGEKQEPSNSQVSGKSETAYLGIIGALLNFIKGESPWAEAHPSFRGESVLIQDMAKNYDGYTGLSKRNLEDKFPAAKRSFEK